MSSELSVDISTCEGQIVEFVNSSFVISVPFICSLFLFLLLNITNTKFYINDNITLQYNTFLLETPEKQGRSNYLTAMVPRITIRSIRKSVPKADPTTTKVTNRSTPTSVASPTKPVVEMMDENDPISVGMLSGTVVKIDFSDGMLSIAVGVIISALGFLMVAPVVDSNVINISLNVDIMTECGSAALGVDDVSSVVNGNLERVVDIDVKFAFNIDMVAEVDSVEHSVTIRYINNITVCSFGLSYQLVLKTMKNL